MILFSCQGCGQLLYFENTRCVRCERTLGFSPHDLNIHAMEPVGGDVFETLNTHNRYKRCRNAEDYACNWLLPADSDATYCAACRHNETVPDLTSAENRALWRKMEGAKHRLFYSLLKFRLPLANRNDDPAHGLAFRFLQDTRSKRVMTGHDEGIITLALKEADDAQREHIRTELGEPYRTLLGHFRHEVGHYYWDVLVRGSERIDDFRALFGDERADYEETLRRHYTDGPPADWRARYVSAYATMHPWEDFAETWAHYLHIVDALETARAFNLTVSVGVGADPIEASVTGDPYRAENVGELVERWLPISFAMNSLNRSIGQQDAYPFVLMPAVIGKLGFVHELIQSVRRIPIPN